MTLGKESETLAFKENISELEQTLIDISAMLNKSKQGTIYFGVRKDGTVCGINANKNIVGTISHVIAEKIQPPVYPTIQVEEKEEKEVISVSFQGSDCPYSCDGRYYIRTRKKTHELSPTELVRFVHHQYYHLWETQDSHAGLEDVDEEILHRFFDRATAAKRIEADHYDKKALLSRLGLLTESGNLNNAGNALFGNKAPILLKMAVFASDEKLTFLDLTTETGNIYRLLDKGEAYIKKNIHWEAEIQGFTRIERPEIPLEAVREILVNSFAHADYMEASSHEIDIHPGRVSIYNPGSFPEGLTPLDYANRSLSSQLRNPLIADVLFRSHDIERWGTGFRRVYSLCREKNVATSYEMEAQGFWFSFLRKKEGNNEPVPNQNLTELEQTVLQEMRDHPNTTAKDISLRTGRSERTIQRVISGLKEKGRVERIGNNVKGYWKLH